MLRRFSQEELPETQAPSVRSLLRDPPLWLAAGLRDAEALEASLRVLEQRFLAHLARATADACVVDADAPTEAGLPSAALRALLQRELTRFRDLAASIEAPRPTPRAPRRQDPT